MGDIAKLPNNSVGETEKAEEGKKKRFKWAYWIVSWDKTLCLVCFAEFTSLPNYAHWLSQLSASQIFMCLSQRNQKKNTDTIWLQRSSDNLDICKSRESNFERHVKLHVKLHDSNFLTLNTVTHKKFLKVSHLNI